MRPGPDPFLRAEVVHSSERTRITRLFLPGRTVTRTIRTGDRDVVAVAIGQDR